MPGIFAIVNPASGGDVPILNTFNTVFNQAGWDWQVGITKKFGDARQMAQKAAEDNFDLIAIYGGDGSVMEAATGLMNTGKPLAIFPGGTGNVFSKELGIPQNLMQACELAVNGPNQARMVDMGLVNGEHYFVLRFATGWEAEMTDLADRDMKDKLGKLAYTVAGIQAVKRDLTAHYRFTLDGEVQECDGMTCMIANTGNMGIPGANINLAPGSSVSDGYLDVVVYSLGNSQFWTKLLMFSVMRPEDEIRQDLDNMTLSHQWKARKIRIEADPPMKINLDGEIIGETPSEIEVVPAAFEVIVPAQ
jgi:YegS/Rv2252/BmrU family lipid kinase